MAPVTFKGLIMAYTYYSGENARLAKFHVPFVHMFIDLKMRTYA